MDYKNNDVIYRENIRSYLTARANSVRVDANGNLMDLSVLSEDFYCEFLNILLGLSLENANVSKQNVAGIDLIDWTHHVAVQVSVTCSPQSICRKIRDSVSKFEKSKDDTWQYYYVPITDKAPDLTKSFDLPEGLIFDHHKDILDITRIMALSKGIDKLQQLSELVDKYGKQPKLKPESVLIIGSLIILALLIIVFPFTRNKRTNTEDSPGEENGQGTSTNGDFPEPERQDDFSILINIGQMRMAIAETFSVPYSFNLPEAYEHELKWSSSNSDCVTVSEKGVLTAHAIGEAEITVCFQESKYTAQESFMVFVLDGLSEQNDGLVSIVKSSFCESNIDNSAYYIFFDIENPFKKEIKKATIEVFAKTGSLSQTFDYPETSNIAGYFSLSLLGEYVVLARLETTDGEQYYSEPWLLRPQDELP